MDFWQNLFTRPEVNASKREGGDVLDTIEEFETLIEEAPWEDFDPEHRVALAIPAMGSVRTTMQVYEVENKLTKNSMVSVITSMAFTLLNAVALTDDPFEGAGIGLVKMKIRQEQDDGLVESGPLESR